MQKWILRHSSFGGMLALIMVGFTLIPMLILTGLGIYNVEVQLQDSSLTQTTTVAALVQQAISNWIGEAKMQLATTQADATQNLVTIFANNGDTSAVQKDLNRALFVLTTRYFSDVYLVTTTGQVILSNQINSQGKNLDVNLVALTGAGKYSWGFSDSTFFGPHSAILWQPIRDQSRILIGFLVGRIAVDTLSSVIQNNTVGMGQTGETYLIDADSLTLTQLRFPGSSASPPRLSLKPASTRYNVNGNFSGLFDDYSAHPVIGVVQPLQAPISASLVVHQQQSEAFSSLYRIVNSAVILAVGLMAMAILASILISQRIIHPLQRLSAAAGAMAGGNLSTHVDIVRNDEIGILATAFNRMAFKLSEIFNELAESNRILRLRAEQLSAINNVGQQAVEALDLNVLLDTAAEAIQKTFNYYAVALYLPDLEHSQMVCCTVASTTTTAKRTNENLSRENIANTNFIGGAALSRKIVNVPDVRQDARYIPDALYPNTASEICVPLSFGTHLVGILDIRSERPNAFVDHDLDMMNILAHQLAIAIRNADLFADSEIARKLADDANRHKSEFLSNMSHELRTPLNVIIGYSSSILNHSAMYDNIPLPAVYESAIKGIMSGGQHLLGLINDILDLSKIEAGKIELSIEPMDPLPVVEGVRATAIGLVKPDVKVRADYDLKLPLIMGDELRIRQILLNLVSNAAKFTEHGSITIDAQVSGNDLMFTVNDTGMGIPEDAHANIFQRFKQANRDVSRSYGGTGLGLNIARQLVLMQGGTIGFESQLGQGTKFFFTVPLAADQVSLPLPKNRNNEISSRVSLFDSAIPLLQQVLLVDTASQTRHTLQTILAQHNYDVLEADTLAQALEISELIAPDLVVIHLHRTDSEEIRGLPMCYEKSPVLAGLAVILFEDLTDFSEAHILSRLAAFDRISGTNL